MTALILVALIPFAALGIAIGHLLNVESMGPALGGIASLFAFLGGAWFPITGRRLLREFCQAAAVLLAGPGGSRRLAAAPVGPPRPGWSSRVWSVGHGVRAARAYRRDTRRV